MRRTILFCGDYEEYAEFEKVVRETNNYLILPYCENLEKLNTQLCYADAIVFISSWKDSMDFMQSVKENEAYHPITTSVVDISDCITEYIHSDVLMYHPCNFWNILMNLDRMFDDKRVSYEKTIVCNMLKDIGMPANLQGYTYLRSAILVCIHDETNLECVTKLLYPSIAKKYNTTPTRVERSMRHAIEKAFQRGNMAAIDSMFGYTVDSARSKPTNSEFIATLTTQVKLQF